MISTDKETAMDLDALAFGAHADDVELGCGGTLIKLAELGHRTGIAVLTRGEMATRGSAEIRAGEFTNADGRVERTWENKLKIIGVLRAHRPKIVFAPYWVDRHPDHEEASCLVRQAAYLSGLKKIETGDPPFRPHKVIYYQTRFEFTPSFIVDISGVHERKMGAIRAYGSQFHRPGQAGPGSEETLIGRPEFLATIETRDRHSGAQIGVMFGEPFLVREALKLEDPVGFFGPEYLWTIP
jgi:bacillithiol biosynthesis deacetylase BshB1